MDAVGDMIVPLKIINHTILVQAGEHWQIAMDDPPPVTVSLTWIEQLWLDGHKLRVEFSQL